MPFYFRKSVSVGPFRFNLSKSGIGVSAGIRGFRVGTGPRGHYIHAGAGGLYYRSSIPSGGRSSRQVHVPQAPPQPRRILQYSEKSVEMIPVSSGDVLEMEDARFADILADLTAKQNATSMTLILGIVGALVTWILMATAGPNSLIVGLLFTAAALFVGSLLDSSQRTAVLMYDLDEDARGAYEELTTSFDGLAACSAKWHIDSGGAIRDIHAWKRNAGAAHLVDKRPTTFNYSLPRVIKSNIVPPAIQSGKETLYFLPDFLLVVDRNKVGAVAYDNLTIRWQDSNFIVDGARPSDAQVLYYTWKHPNKSGGPDRRFRSNYQIPVCLYESIYLTSPNGLNELLQVSRNGKTQPFAQAVKRLAEANGSKTTQVSLPALTVGA